MFFVAEGCSDTGRVRDHNEDAFRIDAEHGLFVVADGMGGHAAGEVASELAVNAICRTFFENFSNGTPCEEELFQEAVEEANRVIYEDARQNPDRRGMGTTLTFVCWTSDGFHCGHVGDSRAYRLRDDTLTQLTRDHTWVNMQVRSGVMSREDAKDAQMRNVLVKALGTQPEVEADFITLDVLPKDRFMLCSDGLSDMVNDEDIQTILAGPGSPGKVAASLVEAANANGGKDNITAIVIDCHDAKWKSRLVSAVDKLRR